jgi:pimeloyl-ACP methyl ester carboxylesterase
MLEDQFVDIKGIRTRYWQTGDRGSPVVLLHGIGCSVLEWERNMAALARSHQVFALDLLGFGLTDKPADESYSLRRLAQFVLDFMSAKQLSSAHLAGNSLGGRLALECVLIDASRVSSLLLVDPAGIDRHGALFEFRLTAVPFLGELFTRPNRLGTKMLWSKAFFESAPFVTKQLVSTKVALASMPGAQAAFLKTLRSFLAFGGFRAELVDQLHAALPAIAIPTLVIWGENDRLVPASHAEVLRKHLPKVEVQIWRQCGHVPQIERAAQFNETALRFWADMLAG